LLSGIIEADLGCIFLDNDDQHSLHKALSVPGVRSLPHKRCAMQFLNLQSCNSLSYWQENIIQTVSSQQNFFCISSAQEGATKGVTAAKGKALCCQAVEGSPIKPSQAARDERGRVNLDELTDADLDYGTDERVLASLRRRLKRAIYTYEGTNLAPFHDNPGTFWTCGSFPTSSLSYSAFRSRVCIYGYVPLV